MPKHRKKLAQQPQLNKAIQTVKLNLIIKGQRQEIDCFVYRYTDIGQELPDFPLGGDPVSIKKIVNGERQESLYLPLYCGFDIETTNIITEDSKAAYMYHWQLVIASNEIGFIYLGRTWETFKDIYYRICDFYIPGIVSEPYASSSFATTHRCGVRLIRVFLAVILYRSPSFSGLQRFLLREPVFGKGQSESHRG